MTNYYKQFEKFKETLENKKDIPIESFKHDMMVFFGFGGRNKTVGRWLSNFETVGYIEINERFDDYFVNVL